MSNEEHEARSTTANAGEPYRGDQVMKRLLPLVMFVSLGAFLAPLEQAHADLSLDLIANGDFSLGGTPPDAFASWTSTTPDAITDGGGFAKFTNGSGLFADLDQTFTIPTGTHITSLSFEFKPIIIS